MDRWSATRRSFVLGVASLGAAAMAPVPSASAAVPALSPVVTRRPVIASDRQGFNRRWFAPNLEAVYVPSRLEDVAPCVEAALGE